MIIIRRRYDMREFIGEFLEKIITLMKYVFELRLWIDIWRWDLCGTSWAINVHLVHNGLRIGLITLLVLNIEGRII
jgi:hypothetical protein